MTNFFLLLGSVLVLAVFAAGILPGVIQILALLLCIACIVPAVRRTFPQASSIPGWRYSPGLFAAVLAGLVLFSIVPFPSHCDVLMGHRRASQNALARKAIQDANRLGVVTDTGDDTAKSGTPWFSMSRNRAGSMRILLLMISGFAAATLSSRLSAAWGERYLRAVTVIGLLMAVAGYVSQWVLPQEKHVWWFLDVPHGHPVACFINRNHFAGFVAMLCPVSLVLLAESISRRRVGGILLWGSSFGLMCMAVAASLSRGAWVACAVGLFVVVIMMGYRRLAMGVGLSVLLLCVLTAVVWPHRHQLEERLKSASDYSTESSLMLRLLTSRDSLGIMRDYPLLGIGANGFRMMSPQYRTTIARKEFLNAEDEYVQLPVEFGFVGIVLVAGLFLAVGRKWRLNHRCGVVSRTVTLSVFAAIAVVMTHAVVEFALRVPLYAVVFASLVGLVVSGGGARTITSPSGNMDNSGHNEEDPSHRRRLTGVVVLPAAGILIAVCVGLLGLSPHNLDSTDYIVTADAKQLCRALEWSPTSWQAWYHLGRCAIIADPGGETGRFGERCMTLAANYAPQNYPLWTELTEVRLRMGDREGAIAAYGQVKRLRSWVRIPELEK